MRKGRSGILLALALLACRHDLPTDSVGGGEPIQRVVVEIVDPIPGMVVVDSFEFPGNGSKNGEYVVIVPDSITDGIVVDFVSTIHIGTEGFGFAEIMRDGLYFWRTWDIGIPESRGAYSIGSGQSAVGLDLRSWNYGVELYFEVGDSTYGIELPVPDSGVENTVQYRMSAPSGEPVRLHFYSGTGLVDSSAYTDGCIELMDGGCSPLPPGSRIGHSSLPEQLVQGSVWVRVYRKPAPRGFQVECLPNPAPRGSYVECSARMLHGVPFAVTGRFALDSATRGANATVVDRTATNVAAGGSAIWEGFVATTTLVKFNARWDSAGVQVTTTDSTLLHVLPRSGWTFLRPDSLPVRVDSVRPPITPYPIDSVPISLYVGEIRYGGRVMIQAGPNTGVAFFVEPATYLRPKAFFHPALRRLPGFETWYDDQNGGADASGQPRCGPPGLAAFALQAERHEGLTGAANSHYGIEYSRFAMQDLNLGIEGLTAASTSQLLVDAKAIVATLKPGPAGLDTSHAQLDAVDYHGIISGLGCRLDWAPPPGDP